MFLQIFGFFRRICYSECIFLLFLMRLFVFFGCVLLSFGILAAPSFAGDNITKSDFTIDLGQIDPIRGTTGATEQWQQAILMLLSKVSGLLLFIIPIVAAVSLMIAGYYYILSSWDSEKATQAKTIIKWNLVAILVALFSYAIIQLLAALLEGTIG